MSRSLPVFIGSEHLYIWGVVFVLLRSHVWPTKAIVLYSTWFMSVTHWSSLIKRIDLTMAFNIHHITFIVSFYMQQCNTQLCYGKKLSKQHLCKINIHAHILFQHYFIYICHQSFYHFFYLFSIWIQQRYDKLENGPGGNNMWCHEWSFFHPFFPSWDSAEVKRQHSCLNMYFYIYTWCMCISKMC